MSSGGARANRKGSLGSVDGSGGIGDDELRTVGEYLAAIATCMTESLRILMFADKRQWGPDEFEQTRALEEALDEAKEDFQEMAPLVNGQFYYENDRTPESLQTLRNLLDRFQSLTQNLRDWVRHGGPINPVWARETAQLRRALHRAQRRAAGRIFAAVQQDPDEGGARCLGAARVYRQQKRNQAERARRPAWQQQQHQHGGQQRGRTGGRSHEGMEATRRPADLVGHGGFAGSGYDDGGADVVGEVGSSSGGGGGGGVVLGRRGSLEELVPSCNAIGRFRLFGEDSRDAAFVCDYCDGFIVWPDLQSIPSERSPLPPTAVSGYPHWQAKGISAESGEEKQVVFPPVAIANHMPPEPGDFRAGLICPYCEEATYLDEGEDSSDVKYVQDEKGMPDLEAFREHLEWYHTALPVPPISSLTSALPSASNCTVM
ncbi:uncharacterized protein P884DRAFT_239295 [Thermothelomyces heterothallicus CBS 202.75]|uniref:uncharacterized protein n=1 Tax=Thermothelomyces heterothallicus CBS 202.75 TaxID=1149848 RepID=UPI0037428B8A